MRIPRFTNGELLGAAILLLSFWHLAKLPLWHTDVWAHTKYGEAYSELGFFEHEPLSPFTDHEARFSHVAWLSQLTYFKLWQFGASLGDGSPEGSLETGAEMLRLFHFALLMCRLTLIWLTLKRFGGSNGWAAVCLGLYVLAVGIGSAIQRPQAFALLFMSILLYALSSPVLSRRSLFGLPVMFCLWANMHGTFVVGLAVLGLHTLGRIFEKGVRDEDTRRLILAGVAGFAMTMLNPGGPWLYQQIIAFSAHPNIKTMTEWHPMRFKTGGGRHWPYLMSLVMLAFIWFLGRRKVGMSGWLLAVPFALWPWMQERALLWWWPIVLWLLARLGPGMGDRFPTMPSLPEGTPSRWKFLLPLGVAVCLTISLAVSVVWNRYSREMPALSRGTPVAFALELTAPRERQGDWLPELRTEINKRYADGHFHGVIFSSEGQGDFLIWALPKEMPVTLFTHAHVFGQKHWDDCLDVKAGEPNSLEILRNLDACLLIVETDTHTDLCRIIRESDNWLVIVDEIPPSHRESETRSERFIAIRK